MLSYNTYAECILLYAIGSKDCSFNHILLIFVLCLYNNML